MLEPRIEGVPVLPAGPPDGQDVSQAAALSALRGPKEGFSL